MKKTEVMAVLEDYIYCQNKIKEMWKTDGASVLILRAVSAIKDFCF